jgi:hypothetical protein
MSDDIFSDEAKTAAPSANKGASDKAASTRKAKVPKHDPKKEVVFVDILAHYSQSGMSGVTLAEAVLMLDQGGRAGWDLQIRSGFVTGDGDPYDLKFAKLKGLPAPKTPEKTRFRVVKSEEALAVANMLQRRYVFKPEGTDNKIDLFRGRWAGLPEFASFCKRAADAYSNLVSDRNNDESKVTGNDLDMLVRRLAGKVDSIDSEALSLSASEALGL